MAKCPKCGAEISELNRYVRGETKSRFMLDKQGDGQSWEVDFFSDEDQEDYECPVCSEALTHDWDEAEAILRGEEKANETNERAGASHA